MRGTAQKMMLAYGSGLCCFITSTFQTTRIGTYLTLQLLLAALLTELTSCQLEDAPRFLDMNLNYTYNRGDLATLYCRVENLGTRFVIWRRTSQPNPISVGTDIFAPDDRYQVQRIKYRGAWNLQIKKVTLKDAGVYECQISAKERAGSRRLVLLRVLDPPPPSQKTPSQDIIVTGSPYVDIGNSLKLMCNASTDDFPSDEVDWFKDGQKIYQDKRTKFSKYISFDDRVIYSTLTISDARLGDAGIYVCRVSDVQINSTKINVLGSERSQNKNTKRDMTATGALGREKSNDSQRLHCDITFTCFLFILTIYTFHKFS